MEDPLDFKKEKEDEVKVKELDADSLEDDSKEDTKKLMIAIGVIIGLFVLFFGAGYVYSKYYAPEQANTIDDLHRLNMEGKAGEDDYTYRGFSFVYFDNLWYTQVQSYERDELIDIPLHFGPKDLDEVEVLGTINDSFMKDEVYVAFNPTEKDLRYVALASAELSLNLAKGIGVKPLAACDRNETEACATRPIVNCDSEDKAVIYLQKTNETAMVKLDGNCVEILGNQSELVKATDRFLLKWYQVMD